MNDAQVFLNLKRYEGVPRYSSPRSPQCSSYNQSNQKYFEKKKKAKIFFNILLTVNFCQVKTN